MELISPFSRDTYKNIHFVRMGKYLAMAVTILLYLLFVILIFPRFLQKDFQDFTRRGSCVDLRYAQISAHGHVKFPRVASRRDATKQCRTSNRILLILWHEPWNYHKQFACSRAILQCVLICTFTKNSWYEVPTKKLKSSLLLIVRVQAVIRTL